MPITYVERPFTITSTVGSSSTLTQESGRTADGRIVVAQTVTDDGAAIDQVFATELDALRAHKDNTDPTRRVRFLPYGMSVSALD